MAYHYRRYRRTCCTPKRSRIEATKQAADQLDISPQAVRNHLRTLRTDNENTDSVVDHLEIIDHRIAEQSTPLGRQLRQTSERLVRVLDKIAAIDQTPSIEPTDIRIEDTKMDHPNKRRRILDTDNDIIGVTSDRPASYSDPLLERQMLEGIDSPDYFTENAIIRSRDIATYNTEYSRVIREIFNAVQSEMQLSGKQKPGPTISSDGDDNSAVRAALPFPDTINSSVPFAHISIQYWESGASDVSITTRPDPDVVHDEHDPSLSGPMAVLNH